MGVLREKETFLIFKMTKVPKNFWQDRSATGVAKLLWCRNQIRPRRWLGFPLTFHDNRILARKCRQDVELDIDHRVVI